MPCTPLAVSLSSHRRFPFTLLRNPTPAVAAAAAMASVSPAIADATARTTASRPLTTIYRYERLGALGRGACAVVYEARDRCTGETVAVKCFCPPGGGGGRQEDAHAFARERHCLEACRGHPSVVQLRDVAVDPNCSWDRYLVMEFAGGCTLRDLIFCGRPFSDAETRALMRQLLAGARAIHCAGLIHRDIKPANVLVGPGCTLKFCDFGDATPAIPPHEEFLVGTLRYTSPEQLVGDRYYGQAVDMWALGCVMAELLTGRLLFTLSETAEEHYLDLLDLRDCDVASKDSPAFGGLTGLSPAGREVLAGLLSFDQQKRLTAEEALEHRWFTEEADSPAVLKHLADVAEAEKNKL